MAWSIFSLSLPFRWSRHHIALSRSKRRVILVLAVPSNLQHNCCLVVHYTQKANIDENTDFAKNWCCSTKSISCVECFRNCVFSFYSVPCLHDICVSLSALLPPNSLPCARVCLIVCARSPRLSRLMRPNINFGHLGCRHALWGSTETCKFCKKLNMLRYLHILLMMPVAVKRDRELLWSMG